MALAHVAGADEADADAGHFEILQLSRNPSPVGLRRSTLSHDGERDGAAITGGSVGACLLPLWEKVAR